VDINSWYALLIKILRLLKISFFFCKLFVNIKSPSANAKGLRIDKLPLLGRFRTFKGDITIENIRLIS